MAEFETLTHGTTLVLSVEGRIESDEWKALKELLDKETTGEEPRVVVDLSRLTFIASSGFRELFLAGKKVARAHGKMVLCGLQGEAKRLFELAGIAAAFPLFETREEAIESLENH